MDIPPAFMVDYGRWPDPESAMNTDKPDNVRVLDVDEIDHVAGAKAGEPVETVVPPDASASQLQDGSAVLSVAADSERITPLRRFLSMRI